MAGMTIARLDAAPPGSIATHRYGVSWVRCADRCWKFITPNALDWFASDIDELTLPAAGHDPVDHPSHYTSHPSGIECIQITEHMGFLLGNAMKYIWRADMKRDAIEDLKKARWYLDREIAKREAQ